MDVVRDVGANQPEAVALEKMRNVVSGPGQEVVQGHYVESVVEQPSAQMRSDEPGSPGNYCASSSHRCDLQRWEMTRCR
jgi:hypothetical protein